MSIAAKLWFAVLVLASGLLVGQGQAQCEAGTLADSLTPSREGFFREALFAAKSARTPRFDDYTPGSYHADKLDIAAGLPSAATKCGLTLDGLVVVGPVGPLWAYHVVVFVREGKDIRVNSLVMPHARITGKGTGVIAPAELTELFSTFATSSLLKPGRQASSDTTKTGLAREFSWDFLAIRFGSDSVAQWSGSITMNKDSVGVEQLLKPLNGLLSRTQPTYPE